MKKILLDANFLIDLIKYKIDVDGMEELVGGDCRLVVLKPVLTELRKISGGKSKDSRFAKIALMVIKEKGFDIVETEEKKADEAIVRMADEDTAVATNDIELKKRLRALGVRVIHLRAKKHLAVS